MKGRKWWIWRIILNEKNLVADVRPITGFKPTFQDRQHFSNFSAWILFLLSLCFQTNFYRCQEKQKVESVSGFWPAPGGGALVANKNKSWTENWFLISPSSDAEFSAAFSALVNILMLGKGTKGGEICISYIFGLWNNIMARSGKLW